MDALSPELISVFSSVSPGHQEWPCLVLTHSQNTHTNSDKHTHTTLQHFFFGGHGAIRISARVCMDGVFVWACVCSVSGRICDILSACSYNACSLTHIKASNKPVLSEHTHTQLSPPHFSHTESEQRQMKAGYRPSPLGPSDHLRAIGTKQQHTHTHTDFQRNTHSASTKACASVTSVG